MSNLLALTWRCLLVVALVFNPVAGAGMAMVAPAQASSVAEPDAVVAKMPPCHAMAAHEQATSTGHGKPAPASEHGCGCGNAACEFGACCGLAVPNVPALLVAFVAGAQSLPTRELHELATPPAARMIRPPIA